MLRYILYFLLIMNLISKALPNKEIVGYYPSWQWYDRNHLVCPASIDYSKYTIINYAFFYPNQNGIILGTDAWADENLLLGQINWQTVPPSYYPNTSLVDLAHNNGVKVLISIGGFTLSNNFPSIAANAGLRGVFAQQCRILCQTYNLDGIDIDWEYPGYAPHNGTPNDIYNYTLLLQAIRDSIDVYGAAINRQMLLTACAGAAQERMANVQWDSVMNILDFVNLMSYDFFGTWDNIANHNSPLYAPAQGEPTFNSNSAINTLINQYNVSPSKINLGLAFYGRSMKTVNVPVLFGAITGQPDNATFWQDEGCPLYYNILNYSNLFSYHWDSTAKVPYLTGNGSLYTFVSFDDKNSIGNKAKYIVDNNLRGAIIWEITGDYLETSPGSGIISSTPLIDTLNYVFSNYIPDSIEIELNHGWNLISANIIPFNTNIENIFSETNGLLLVKNQLGQIYDPINLINTISNWNYLDGYYIYTNSSSILKLSGIRVLAQSSPLNLSSSWNLVPYLCKNNNQIQNALQNILASIKLVKDNEGNIFFPEYYLNQIGEMKKGNAYLINLNSSEVLIFTEE